MATREKNQWERMQSYADKKTQIGGVDNLVVWKKDGDVVGAGIKDSFRNEDGDIVRGTDFRKSEKYKNSTGEEKREYRKKLKSGTLLTNDEQDALLDEDGNLRKESINGDQDINKNLKMMGKLKGMRDRLESMLDDQETKEKEFDSKEDVDEHNPNDDYQNRTSESRSASGNADQGHSGGISKRKAFSHVDHEIQEWKNSLEAALTPPGPAV